MSEIEKLKILSAKIGADPLLIQAAGGNTSVKEGDLMWIKASGTWLSDAQEDDIFVPVELSGLLEALHAGDPRADNGVAFVDTAQNPKGLRPSIETTVHAVFPQKVVVHVHCVNTIALAIRVDAKVALEERLHGHNWAFVPYIRPGAPLSREIQRLKNDDTDVVILGNHGLIVAAETVDAAEALLAEIVKKLSVQTDMKTPDYARLHELAGEDFSVPDDPAIHQLALDEIAVKRAISGSLYPDHVIFLGIGASLFGASTGTPPMLIVPNAGVILRKDASPGAIALSRCLSDVLTRVPKAANLRYFTDEENDALINWDAEKYRQSLNTERSS